MELKIHTIGFGSGWAISSKKNLLTNGK